MVRGNTPISYELLHFFNGIRLIQAAVNDHMTVGADGSKVFNRVYFMFLVIFTYGIEVVDVDSSFIMDVSTSSGNIGSEREKSGSGAGGATSL